MASEFPPAPEQPKQAETPTANASFPSLAAQPIFVQPIFTGRLHPLTLLFGLWRGARNLWPMIPLLVFGNRSFAVGMFALAALGAIVTAFVRYFSFSYRIEGGELITQEGLLERRQRNIPLERVQEIRIEQGVLHRLFDVVDAGIETGGGGGAEATLSVLSRAEAERLRQTVFERSAELRAQRQAAPVAAAPEQTIIRQISVGELVLAGVTSNHLVSALALAGALWGFADDILPERVYEDAARYLSRVALGVAAQGAKAAVLVTLAGLAAIFLLGLLFSTVGSLVLFYGFTLARRGDDLQRRYGLLTRRASSLPRRRIQVLQIEETLLRRLFGLATLRADISGSRREDDDDNDGRDVLLPLVRRNEIVGLLAIFFPDYNAEQSEWRRVSRLAIRRGVLKGAVFCVLAAAGLFFWRRDWLALAPLFGLPLVYAVNVLRYRTLGYALGERYLSLRRGWLGRATQIVPLEKVQAVELRQTPFDRRLGLASLSVDTAGQAYTGGGPQISNLPLAEAERIAQTLARKAAVLRYRW